jgi:hypothetical protein
MVLWCEQYGVLWYVSGNYYRRNSRSQQYILIHNSTDFQFHLQLHLHLHLHILTHIKSDRAKHE